jgi:hypothetical protein
VILTDNHKMHKTPDVMEVIKELDVPLMFTGVAAFDAVPVELVFSRIKREFKKEYLKRLNSGMVEGESDVHCSLSDTVVKCIVASNNNVGANVIKAAYIN